MTCDGAVAHPHSGQRVKTPPQFASTIPIPNVTTTTTYTLYIFPYTHSYTTHTLAYIYIFSRARMKLAQRYLRTRALRSQFVVGLAHICSASWLLCICVYYCVYDEEIIISWLYLCAFFIALFDSRPLYMRAEFARGDVFATSRRRRNLQNTLRMKIDFSVSSQRCVRVETHPSRPSPAPAPQPAQHYIEFEFIFRCI